MWNVSNKYRQYIGGRTVTSVWYGTIEFADPQEGGIPEDPTYDDGVTLSFSQENIDQNKSKLTRQCITGENLEIGNVYSAELVLGLRDSASWTISDKAYEYYDAKITLWFKLIYPDNTDESVLCGTFTVNKAERTYHTVLLTAYDDMSKFNIKLTDKYTGTFDPYSALNMICVRAGITLGMTESQIRELPNGTRDDLNMSVFKKGASFKDILGNICAMLGTNAVCDRYGRLLLLQYGTSSVRELQPQHRYSTNFIDYVGRYTTIYIVNKKGEVEKYDRFFFTSDRKLAMNIGKNLLLNSYESSARETIIQNILQYLKDIIYSPCNVTMPADPSIDIGDMVTVTGGELGTDEVSILCMKMEMPLFGQMRIVSEAGSYELDVDEYATEKERKDQDSQGDQIEINNNVDNSITTIDNSITQIDNSITDINNSITNIDANMQSMAAKMAINYIFPYQINTGSISDGSNAYVLRFRFKCDREGDTVAFYSTIAFTVASSTSNGYGDCNLTVTYLMDDTQTASFSHTYGDGNAILTLNGCMSNPGSGDHTFDVKFALSGGSIS